ncbi:MAG: Hsp20/alpha crystallin family protein [Gammaproteobacteria bacterium]|nr:Hsp20/alpha crystallin family protein [Gammaproteobacteria bacterium]
MAMVRWTPFEGIDDFFNRMLPGAARTGQRLGIGEGGRMVVEWAPSADISETDKEYLIRAELPGVKKEDVKVTMEQGVITVSGERKQHQEDKGEKFHRVETFQGSFARSFTLPDDVDSAAVSCESREGVLTVHLPKQARRKPTPVEIKVG